MYTFRVSGLRKGEVKIEHFYGLGKTRFILAHGSRIVCLALTNDGKFLATASTKGTLVRVYNTLDGLLLQEVIDYKTQQHKLFPLLGSAYAFRFAGQLLSWLYKDVTDKLQANDFSMLPEAHACTAGLKSLTTSATTLDTFMVDRLSDQDLFMIRFIDKLKEPIHGKGIKQILEANVYHATRSDGQELAIKVYKTSVLVFKDRYVQGDYRFRYGYCRHNPRKMVKTWAEKEMRNLMRGYRSFTKEWEDAEE
ncbi:hypothetical protein AgCh_019746 [Apium graveolens]